MATKNKFKLCKLDELISFTANNLLDDVLKANEPMDVEKIKNMADFIGLAYLNDEIDALWETRRDEILEQMKKNELMHIDWLRGQ